MRRKIVNFFFSIYNRFFRIILRKLEIRNFKAKRRKKIYNQIVLTKKQKKEIYDLYLENYGKKIPYTWHRHYTAFTNNFDKNYFPELLYIPEFEFFMNFEKYYCKSLSDKNLLPLIASNANVKMPKTILSCTEGIYRDGNYKIIKKEKAIELIQNIGECFVKPTKGSSSGRGCLLLNIIEKIDQKTNEPLENIFDSLGLNFVVQERLKCHESITKIYEKSVNTFRVMTYRWKDEIIYVPAIMRIGQGGNYVDNAHAGGMFIAIENDGTLHETAFTEFKTEYKMHPDSKLIYKNYKIELFPKVLETAIKMHSLIPQVGIVNWDFTIDENGEPVLIEANLKAGSIWLFEMAWGKGPFGDKTAEILRWINYMKHIKVEDIPKYSFGNIKGEK